MANVLIDYSTCENNSSGIARYTSNLTENLIKTRRRYNIVLGYYKNKPNKRYAKSQAYVIPRRLVNFCLRWTIGIPAELISGKKNNLIVYPDFISWPSLFKSTKIMSVIHDLAYLHYPETLNKRNRRYLTKQIPKTIERSDIIITVSSFIKNEIVNNFNIDPSKIRVVGNAVNHNVFQSKKSDDNVVLNKYKLGLGYLLFVGNLEPRKNIIRIVESYANTFDNHGLSLVLVGSKGWNNLEIYNCLNLYKKLPILILGFVDDIDLAALYRNATALVYTSLYEGFGLPILEAMACGCPVITSNLSSMKEVAGGSALLVNPNSKEEISNALLTVAKKGPMITNLIRNGVKRSKLYSWENSARAFDRLIVEVLGEK